jgi:hypothetical protein
MLEVAATGKEADMKNASIAVLLVSAAEPCRTKPKRFG